MPVITVTMGKGQADVQQKKELIRSFTSTAVEVTKIPADKFIILFHELEADCVGVGGQSLKEILAE